jgi:hypothetical protein
MDSRKQSIGEVLALSVSIGLLRYRLAIPIQYFAKPLFFSLVGLILATLLWNAGLSHSSSLFVFFVAVSLSIGMVALFLLFFPDFRKEIKIIISPLLSRINP